MPSGDLVRVTLGGPKAQRDKKIIKILKKGRHMARVVTLGMREAITQQGFGLRWEKAST